MTTQADKFEEVGAVSFTPELSSTPHESSNRWSCVLNSSGNAWNYNNNGMSNNNGFGNTLAVRPVTKFKR